jgi:hypothetical protein
VRIGFTSGVRGGGCLRFDAHGEHWGFRLDVDALTGANVSDEVGLRPSLTYRIGSRLDAHGTFALHVGPEVLFGRTDEEVPQRITHFGVNGGVGYDLALGDVLMLHVLDAALYADWRTDSVAFADDSAGRRRDIGLLLTTGIAAMF